MARKFFVRCNRNRAANLPVCKRFLCKMTENLPSRFAHLSESVGTLRPALLRARGRRNEPCCSTVQKRSAASFFARHLPRGSAAGLRTANAVRKALQEAPVERHFFAGQSNHRAAAGCLCECHCNRRPSRFAARTAAARPFFPRYVNP